MKFHTQYIAFLTISRKELTRILRIWPQTCIPPVITSSLYFIIFGTVLGQYIGNIDGSSYIDFILPGLVLMNVISSSYANSVASFFSEKFQRSIEEIVKSPAKSYVIIFGYSSGGMMRGIINGILIILVASFFTSLKAHNIYLMAIIMVMTSFLFAILGIINGIFARSWDDVNWMTSFVITPMSYLGGIFYSVKQLSPFWQKVSMLNPIFYFIDSFRYAMLGIKTLEPHITILAGISFIIFFSLLATMLFDKLMRR
ncbi:MAG: ABC transporter permease [Alphaproteobacteria bacterium]|nr:ABC transporter permease [Alphaproteobacteria bacterium]